jgi:hypothetical protein
VDVPRRRFQVAAEILMAVRLDAVHPAPLHVDPTVVVRPARDGKGIVGRPLAVPKASDYLLLSKAQRPQAVAQLALWVGQVRQSDARPGAALRVHSVPRLDGRRKRKFRAPQEKQGDASPVEKARDERR